MMASPDPMHSHRSPAVAPDRAAEPAAVVLGLCAHGLAAVRSLHRSGVTVYALEANSHIPGVHTSLARVVMAPDINGPGLIDALLGLGERELAGRDAVLMPINDNMVRTLAEHWERLEGRFRLSWSAARQQIAGLLDKARIEARCRERQLRYPESHSLGGPDDVQSVIEQLPFPMLVKPMRPLSRFKAIQVQSREALEALVARHRAELPFLAQRWLDGADERIVFGALYLVDGQVQARFEGKKLRSLPRAMGQTTAAVNRPDDEVHAQTVSFFDGLGLSGPVSLEMKRDANGRLWVIEPTVGRTDFWLDCCIANGVDLSLIEYLHMCGRPLPAVSQRPRALWLDSDREPQLWLRLLLDPAAGVRRLRPVFSYCHSSDPGPFVAGLKAQARRLWRIARRRATRRHDSSGIV